MNIENHIYNATQGLRTAQAQIGSRDYVTALALLSKANSNVRSLMDHVLELKRAGSLAEHPAEEGSSLTFTQLTNRIEYLTSQILVHVQEENYQKVREDLDNIHVHAAAAQQQLEKFQWLKSQGGISSEGFGL